MSKIRYSTCVAQDRRVSGKQVGGAAGVAFSTCDVDTGSYERVRKAVRLRSEPGSREGWTADKGGGVIIETVREDFSGNFAGRSWSS